MSGTLTYTLFYVQGEVPSSWKTDFVKNVQSHAFDPLLADDEDGESVGWSKIDRPLDTDFDLYSMLFDHFINLSLRQDRFVIPSAMLKAHLSEAKREYLRKNEKKKLSKFEKDDLKDMVERDLREKQLPRMRLIDMSWDMRAGRVRFWSHSNKMCELFQGFFHDTFGLKLLPANPYIDAVENDLDPAEIEVLQAVEPSNFVGQRATD